MPRSAPEPLALVFGDLATALEPRALSCGPRATATEVRILHAAGALPAGTEALLRSIDGLTLRGAGNGLQELTGPLALLREASTADPALQVLLAAHRNAQRPRTPPRLMGILNVTPDSFSDGGRHLDPDRAVAQGLKLFADGAEIIDVGGESTRPGSPPVSPEEERERVIPVIRRLARETSAELSVDTTKASVAAAALDAGASMVNDVSAGRLDPELLPLVAERDADVVLMHMQNTPRDMQVAPHYGDVVREVSAHLRERVAVALKAGIEARRIAIDPGIGFGKRLNHNLELIRSLPELRSLGPPIVLGVSRKSFLGRLSGRESAPERDAETLAAAAVGHVNGADIHRVHDVAAARAALAVAAALTADELPDELPDEEAT